MSEDSDVAGASGISDLCLSTSLASSGGRDIDVIASRLKERFRILGCSATKGSANSAVAFLRGLFSKAKMTQMMALCISAAMSRKHETPKRGVLDIPICTTARPVVISDPAGMPTPTARTQP
eukprot:CAMPEP_0197681182 /NCGR_PEP_ID=MMETSP1338-20131121/94515_1 /TAXON_ID=43686 ORGANISM="Pelagodinium beii, Strain RCC1491" /NCGR_SAMPLE_ID=MMETSP1338 /ASSEMBLY_ACC=CAM_ASM_000754 /LENGTH=121 /DNA_ID=CAMNT_0043262483 /DNA_START=430 /DNA_END=795 /DNA_ORIENTATION=-